MKKRNLGYNTKSSILFKAVTPILGTGKYSKLFKNAKTEEEKRYASLRILGGEK